VTGQEQLPGVPAMILEAFDDAGIEVVELRPEPAMHSPARHVDLLEAEVAQPLADLHVQARCCSGPRCPVPGKATIKDSSGVSMMCAAVVSPAITPTVT
jgi:hypothetical protein